MPDRDDPDFANRQSAGGPSGDGGNKPLDDPLAELARIVSGRGELDEPSKPDAPGRAADPKPDAKTAEPEADILGDLEAELLSNLQASFSAVQLETQTPKDKPETAAAPPPAEAAGGPDTAAPASSPPPVRESPQSPFGQLIQSSPALRSDTDLPSQPSAPPSPEGEAKPEQRRWPPPMDEIDDDWSGDLPAAIRPRGTQPSADRPAAPAEPAPADRPGTPTPAVDDEWPAPPQPEPPQPAAGAAQQPRRPQPQTPSAQTTASPQSEAPRTPPPEEPRQPARAQRPAFLGKRVDIGSLSLRRGTAAEAPDTGEAPPPAAAASAPRTVQERPPQERSPQQQPTQERPAPSRWEQPSRAPRSPGIERFAPAGGREVVDKPEPAAQPAASAGDPPDMARAPAERLAPRLRAAAQPAVADEAPRAEARGPGPRRREKPAPPPADDQFDFGLGEDDIAAYESEDIDHLIGRRRPGIGLMAVGSALVLVVIVGALSLFFFRATGTDGEPPVIAADTSPTRDDPPTDEVALVDGQNKLIYDRVDDTSDTSAPTVLQPGAEALTDPGAGEDDNPIARVILPDGLDGSSIDTAPNDAATDLQDEIVEPVGPRKVRTVVVRPDGTIVSSQATDDAPPLALTDDGSVAVAPPQPAPTETAPTDDLVAIAGPDVLNGGNELAITPLDDGTGQAVPPAQAPAPVQVQPVEVQPPPVRPPTATPVAPPRQDGPIDLTAGNGAVQPAPVQPSPGQPATTSGGMLVQVSSQRSEEAARATFRDLQARYPSILGGYRLDIQRANVGDRGIFYRVRVGPFSPADAQRLCDDLKAAGGDCILARG